jgi:hypothetical protein
MLGPKKSCIYCTDVNQGSQIRRFCYNSYSSLEFHHIISQYQVCELELAWPISKLLIFSVLFLPQVTTNLWGPCTSMQIL